MRRTPPIRMMPSTTSSPPVVVLPGTSQASFTALREQHCIPALAQALLDVVRRPAAVLALGITVLVDLRQGGFDEGTGGTEKGHHPHPEDRPRAAEGDGHRHAGDVAYADPAGQRDRQ
ncbi:hypothetical protein G6F59_017873 [Rhizopus arrhizus]|nr:hypothetical protein G6F59_017873 [Rhizopus arrhizus]